MVQRLSLPEAIPSNVEVWVLKLNLEMPLPSLDLAMLNEGERLRALLFRRHEDQVRSVATRAALRRMLASRVMRRPDRLSFIVNQYGKPRLEGDFGIEFNVSHAGRFAMIALSTCGPVGIDIESYDRGIDTENLSSYVFTPRERQSPLRRSGEAEDFIERWVAKESILKALGLGISENLQAISVLPAVAESYEIAHDRPEWEGVKAWRLHVPDGYAAALATMKNSDPCPHP
jgi:4'-phosphopantetheinyl transferase